jgi:hypothetical protein
MIYFSPTLKTNVFSFVFLLIFTASCNQKKDSIKIDAESIFPQQEGLFSIVDSIVINEPSVFLKSKKGSKFLFVRHTNQDVVLFDERNKTFLKFNKFGQDPFTISTPINDNIGFVNDSVIWISDVGKIKKFSLEGEFLEAMDVPSINPYTPLSKILFNEKYLYALEIPVGNTSSKEYYEKKYSLFLKHSLTDSIQERFFDFPPKDSKFFTDKYYLAYNVFFYVNYPNKTSATYLYSVEPIIYTVNLEKETISKKTEFSPEYFTPLKVYFKDKPDNTMIFMQAYMGSVFTGHFIVNDINYAFYSIPYSEEFMVEFVKTHKNFPFEEAPDIKFALTVFDNEGKKLRDDIVFPTSLGKALLMDEDGIIYFMKNPTEDDEKKGQTVYYKVRLTDEKQ